MEAAEAQAAAIRKDGEAEAAKLLSQAEAAVSEMKEKEENRLEDVVGRLTRQELSSAELESKKVVLAKKKEILDRSFDETLADLESADAKTKKKYYGMMVAAAKGVIDDPKAYCPPSEGKNLKGLEVSEVIEDPSVVSGLILESVDGLVRLDMQFRNLLSAVWEREIKSLSDILFG